MNACRRFRKELEARLAGGLVAESAEDWMSHLERCPACREEYAAMKEVIRAAGFVKDEMEKAVASVDWNALPAQVVDRVLAADARRRPAPTSWRPDLWFSRHSLRPVFAGAVLGLVVGALAMFFVARRLAPKAEARSGFFASPEFIERAEYEMARRQTLDYLRNSQYLLLDFVRSSPEGSGGRTGLADSARARDLLAKKKYLNSQLDGSRMAQAKAICDQIEILFLELSRLGDGLPEAEIGKVRSMIEDSRLLLKINLVEKELEESEA